MDTVVPGSLILDLPDYVKSNSAHWKAQVSKQLPNAPSFIQFFPQNNAPGQMGKVDIVWSQHCGTTSSQGRNEHHIQFMTSVFPNVQSVSRLVVVDCVLHNQLQYHVHHADLPYLHVCRMPSLLSKYDYRNFVLRKEEEVSVKFTYSTLRTALSHLIGKLERKAILYDAIRLVEKDAHGNDVLFGTEEILDDDLNTPVLLEVKSKSGNIWLNAFCHARPS